MSSEETPPSSPLPAPPRPFRVSAKNLFITWPRCDVSLASAKAQILHCCSPNIPKAYVIAQENHEDGGLHLHATLSFARRINIKNCRKFDLVRGVTTYHGSIEACRDLKQSVTYCKKDENFIEHGDFNFVKDSGWGKAFEQPTKKAFCDYIKETFPRDYILYLDRIEYVASRFYDSEENYSPPPGQQFDLPDIINQWRQQYVGTYLL